MSTPYLGQIILVGFNFAPIGYEVCDGHLLTIANYDALFALIGTTYGGDGVLTFAVPDLRGRIPLGYGLGPGLTSYTLGTYGGTEAVTLVSSQMPAHTHTATGGPFTATARSKNGVGNSTTPVGHVFATGPAVSDSPLTAHSSVVKASHITDLRTRVDALRATASLPPYSYSDPTLTAGTTVIQAKHITELRTAVLQAYTVLSLTPPSFTDPALAHGTPIKAVHIAELRAAAPTRMQAYGSSAPNAAMHPSGIALGGTPVTSVGGGSSVPHANVQPSLAMNYCIAVFGVFPSQN